MADDNTVSLELIAKFDQLQAGLNESQAALGSWATEVTGSLNAIAEASKQTAETTTEALKKLGEQSAESASGFESLKESIMHVAEVLGVLEAIHISWDWLKEGGETAENLTLMAEKTNTSVEALSRMKFAADSTGLSIDTIGATIQRLDMRMANFARTGSGGVGAGLKDLGLDEVAFKAADAEQKFQMLGDAVERFGATDRVLGDLSEILGKSGAQLTPFLERMKELGAESDNLHATMSGPMVQAADEFNESLNALGSQWDAFKVALASALSGPLQGVLSVIEEIVAKVIEWAENGELEDWARRTALALVDFAENAIKALQPLFDKIEGALGKLDSLRMVATGDFTTTPDLSGESMAQIKTGLDNLKSAKFEKEQEISNATSAGPFFMDTDKIQGLQETLSQINAEIAEYQRIANTPPSSSGLLDTSIYDKLREKIIGATTARVSDFAGINKAGPLNPLDPSTFIQEAPPEPKEQQGPQAPSTASIEAAKKAAEEAKKAATDMFAQYHAEAALALADAGKNAEQRFQIEQDFVNKVKTISNLPAKDMIAAEAEASRAYQSLLQDRLKTAEADLANTDTLNKAKLQLEMAQENQSLAQATQAAQLRLASGLETKQQEIADQIQIGDLTLAAQQQGENEKYESTRASLQARLDLLEASGLTETTEIAKANVGLEALEVQHEATMLTLATKGASDKNKLMVDSATESTKETAALFQSIMEPIASGFDQMFKGVIQGTQTLSQAFKKMAEDIGLAIASSGIKDLLLGGSAGSLGSKLFGTAGAGGGLAGLIGGLIPGRAAPGAPAPAAGGAAGAAGAIGQASLMQSISTALSTAFRQSAAVLGQLFTGAFNAAKSALNTLFQGAFTAAKSALTSALGSGAGQAAGQAATSAASSAASGAAGATAEATAFATAITAQTAALTADITALGVTLSGALTLEGTGIIAGIGAALAIQTAALLVPLTSIAVSSEITAIFTAAQQVQPFGFSGGGIVPSAARGMVLGGGNSAGTLALLHPREMVLPSYLSEGFQNMLSGGGKNIGGQTAYGGHQVSVNYAPVIQNGSAMNDAMLRRHADTLGRIIIGKLRDNKHLTDIRFRR